MLATLATPEALESQILVTQQVFLMMASMEVFPSGLSSFDAAHSIDSTLAYYGAGFLKLECSPSVAFAFTSRLMEIPAPTAFNDDVRDALGELANMIGGNLKGLLPSETEISTPSVFPPATKPRFETQPRLSCIPFACAYGAFRMSLFGG